MFIYMIKQTTQSNMASTHLFWTDVYTFYLRHLYLLIILTETSLFVEFTFTLCLVDFIWSSADTY